MNTFSVTVQWETERESQMVETMIVVAGSIEDAKAEALRFTEDRTGYDATVTRVGMVAAKSLKPRVIAQLALNADGEPYWVAR